MKILNLAGILFVLNICRTNGLTIIYDFTDHLNAIMAGSLSVQEFSENIMSFFVGRNSSSSSLRLEGYYAADCNIIWECSNSINDATQIWNDTNTELKTQMLEIRDFQFQLRMDINTLENTIKNPLNQTKLKMPTGKYVVSITLAENTTCDDLKTITKDNWVTLLNRSNWFSPDSVNNVLRIGFGYNEDLIGCERLFRAIRNSPFMLTSLSLGETPGVVESFGIFRKRIENLHTRNIQFVKTARDPAYNEPFIEYYPTPQTVGNEIYRRILNSYWQDYDPNRRESNMGAIVPYLANNRSWNLATDSYSLILLPHIDAESCDKCDSIPWFTISALETLTTHFGGAVLTHAEWKRLKSDLVWKYHELQKTAKSEPDIQLDLIIDYTNWLQDNQEHPNISGCSYNWSTIEDELNDLERNAFLPPENVEVTTLIFPITTNPTTENYITNINSEFAKRMSSQFSIGCGFHATSFGEYNSATGSAVVAACQQINGSVYALQYHFQLEPTVLSNFNKSQYFENEVRPKLEEIKKLRNGILVLHPQATVYFQLRFELLISDNYETVFCNTDNLSLNEYIEAMVNWAAFNAVPLIMGRAFDDIDHNPYQTWFSVLRPMSKDSDYFNPYFVVRNSPKILENMDVETCIDWTVDRLPVTESYFHNNKLGSIFYAKNMRNDKQISRKEYRTLLQFILHRFDLVSVEIDSNSYEDLITALNTVIMEGLVDPRKKFLLYYTPSETKDEEKLKTFNAFLNFTKTTLETNTSFLHGISFGFAAFRATNHTKMRDVELTTRLNARVLGWGRNFNLNLGISMITYACQNTILNSVFRNPILKATDKLLKTAGFIICVDSVNLETHSYPSNLGGLFDTHLYVKKLIHDFQPHLDLYFEVKVDTALTGTTMHDYLVLVSHFQKFAETHNVSYLIANAFDSEGAVPNGWWKISNYSNLSLTSVYEEKYSAFVGFQTWQPPLQVKPTTNISNEAAPNVVLPVLVFGFVLLLVAFGVVLLYFKNRGKNVLSNEDEHEFRNGKKVNGEHSASIELKDFKFAPNCCPYKEELEIAKEEFRFSEAETIGSGNFGCVYKMKLNGFEAEVAVKVPNDSGGIDAVLGALREIKILAYIGTHENVLNILGAYTKQLRRGIVYIVTELCSEGSLLTYLQTSNDEAFKNQQRPSSSNKENCSKTCTERKPIALYDMLRFATEIAKGMDYISKKKVVHADLAARNVLLDHHKTVKICDFGLSKKLYNSTEYVKKNKLPLPWRWMAIETLKKMEFSTLSDVWSYGITVWEIFTLGDVPYPNMEWDDVFTLRLKEGLRPVKPTRCSDQVYELMKTCWNITPNLRPTFAELLQKFSLLKSKAYQQIM